MQPQKNRSTSTDSGARVTLREVAALAGVSVTTASRALNDAGRMQPETRRRVRQAAQTLGYRPNSIARGLVQNRSFTLGLLTNDIYGRFTLPIATGLSRVLADRGVSVLLSSCHDDPRMTRLNLEALEEKRVDGLVIAGRRIDRSLPVELPRSGLPILHVMSAVPEGGVGFLPDDRGGARLATQHLVNLGRRRIAHLTGPRGFESARLRELGWRYTLEDNHADAWGPALFGEWSEQHGFEAALQMFGADRGQLPPDAVFCGNDQIARGLIDGLTRLGVRIPEDVAVVGFDNWEIFADATRPPLTTVDMGLVELGRRAGLGFLNMIEGLPVTEGVTHTPTELVVRASSADT
ncbi:LacI family DNA-binding transcriptional regulator [Kushneria aurantia]|uniref:LacI family DNA-binding transcriptional regulator n=1 Tax=Kushneria aurantia TaxID=504092 RepID=A0ABV6FZQ2_9GAMM|nr:LacI family DNA-binding transcriptional regulator [Kushneria aurantia]